MRKCHRLNSCLGLYLPTLHVLCTTQSLGDKTSTIKLCHRRRNWNTWWPSLNWLCKNLPCASTFLPGSSDSFHWEYHWLRNANQFSTPCVTFGLEKALPVGSAVHSRLGAPHLCQLKTPICREMCFIVIYWKKIMVGKPNATQNTSRRCRFFRHFQRVESFPLVKTKKLTTENITSIKQMPKDRGLKTAKVFESKNLSCSLPQSLYCKWRK